MKLTLAICMGLCLVRPAAAQPPDLVALMIEARDTGGLSSIMTTYMMTQEVINAWAGTRHYDEPSENLSDASRLQVGARAWKLHLAVRAYVRTPTPEFRKTVQQELTMYQQEKTTK